MLLWHIQIILFPLPTLTGNYDCPLDLKYLRLSINIRPWWWKKFANIHRSDEGRVVVRTTYFSLVLSLITSPPRKYNSIFTIESLLVALTKPLLNKQGSLDCALCSCKSTQEAATARRKCREGKNLQNSDCPFHFLIEDFRLCSRCNSANYGT